MHIQSKILNKMLIGGTLLSAAVSQADLFVFESDSTLNETQQLSLKVLFFKSAVDSIKNLDTALQSGMLQTMISQYIGTSKPLSDIVMSYFLNQDRKERDLNAVLTYNEAVEKYTTDPDKANQAYQDALSSKDDALFNSVIRETLKSFKSCISLDEISDDTQLKEAFNVLWKAITDGEVTFDLDEETINHLSEKLPNIDIRALISEISDIQGKNICEKIAKYFAAHVHALIDNTVEASCCCACFKECWTDTKAILPYIANLAKSIIVIINLLK